MREIFFEPESVRRLVPLELITRFHLPDPRSCDFGSGAYHLERDPVRPGLLLAVRADSFGRDPLYIVHLNFSFLENIEISWIAANDPESPRFDVDLLGRLPLEPKSGGRNIPEELRAYDFGLWPNQVRRGLHLLGPALRCVEDYALAVGAGLLSIFPMEYHNAIEYEHYGFGYRSGEDLMRSIHGGFSENGTLTALLDGTGPFRRPELARTVRGRSWAVHDGILDGDWYAPEMFKAVGTLNRLDTAPGVPWT